MVMKVLFGYFCIYLVISHSFVCGKFQVMEREKRKNDLVRIFTNPFVSHSGSMPSTLSAIFFSFLRFYYVSFNASWKRC